MSFQVGNLYIEPISFLMLQIPQKMNENPNR